MRLRVCVRMMAGGWLLAGRGRGVACEYPPGLFERGRVLGKRAKKRGVSRGFRLTTTCSGVNGLKKPLTRSADVCTMGENRCTPRCWKQPGCWPET